MGVGDEGRLRSMVAVEEGLLQVAEEACWEAIGCMDTTTSGPKQRMNRRSQEQRCLESSQVFGLTGGENDRRNR